MHSSADMRNQISHDVTLGNRKHLSYFTVNLKTLRVIFIIEELYRNHWTLNFIHIGIFYLLSPHLYIKSETNMSAVIQKKNGR